MKSKSRIFEPLAVTVAGGSSIKAAAVIVGCSLQAAYNMSGSAEFRQRVAEIRTELTTEAVGKLTEACVEAVDTLRELLKPENEPSVRLNASKAILANVGPLSESGELRARIDAIESQGPGLRVAR